MAKAATDKKAVTGTKARAKGSIDPNVPDVQPGNAKSALSSMGVEGGPKSITMQMVDPNKLRIIEGFNLRIHETKNYADEMAVLMDSIKTEGFYPDKPLAGYAGKGPQLDASGEPIDNTIEDVIYVTDGHRRLEAIKRLNAESEEPVVTSVPIVVKPGTTSMIDLTVSLVKSNTGKPLTMYEKAVAALRLQKAKMEPAEIATRLGFAPRYVEDLLMLITAPKSVREFCRLERIAGTEAVRILRKFGDKKAEAEQKIKEMVSKAEAMGEGKATRKHSGDAPVRAKTKDAPKNEGGEGEDGNEPDDLGDGGKPSVRLHTVETKYALEKGQEFPLAEVRHFKGLFGDDDWYEVHPDRAGWATALEDVRFKAMISRPKRDDAPTGEGNLDDQNVEDEPTEGGETTEETTEDTSEL